MEDYRLEQSGQEVQDILNGAAMQTDLKAENERAELAEQTLQGNIDAEALARENADGVLQGHIDDEETRAKAAEKQNADDIDAIEEKIPTQASSSNQLADKDYVEDLVSTYSATFRGTFNLVSDLHLTVDASYADIAAALGNAIAGADNNDFAFVMIPTSVDTPNEIARIERYKFNGTAWAFEFVLNNSGFTADQWAAINSGITSALVTKLGALPTASELATALLAKQDKLTFDQTPTPSSTNPVTSGGVYTAIDDEKGARVNADAALQQAIEAILVLIPSAATALNQLADKAFVNSSIATATATFRGTFNLVSDLQLTVDATHADIAAALLNAIAGADNNDYAFVQIPTSVDTPTEIRVTERYKFNGTAWQYEYDLNNSGFTAAQWAAINSGITALLVTKLSNLPNATELATLFAGKQNVLTFDNAPVSGSDNPVKSGGLYDLFAAIDAKMPTGASANNKLVAEDRLAAYVGGIIGALDATFDLTSTDGHVTLRMTQTDGVITSLQILTSDIASASALTTLGGQVSTNASDIAALQALYNALQQSAPQIIEPTDTWPVASPSGTVIYRVVDRVNTPPQYYSDYMWNGTAMVLMATYNNAIDPRPKKASQNLVTSGGVFDNMGALDVSELNATENPHALAQYVDLSAALAAVPIDYQKGGMSIKFVQSSDNKYVQYRLMSNTFSTTESDWQGVDDGPTAMSKNLIESGSLYPMYQEVSGAEMVFPSDTSSYHAYPIFLEANKIYLIKNTTGYYCTLRDSNDQVVFEIHESWTDYHEVVFTQEQADSIVVIRNIFGTGSINIKMKTFIERINENKQAIEALDEKSDTLVPIKIGKNLITEIEKYKCVDSSGRVISSDAKYGVTNKIYLNGNKKLYNNAYVDGVGVYNALYTENGTVVSTSNSNVIDATSYPTAVYAICTVSVSDKNVPVRPQVVYGDRPQPYSPVSPIQGMQIEYVEVTCNSDVSSGADYVGNSAVRDAIAAITDASYFKRYILKCTGVFKAVKPTDYQLGPDNMSLQYALFWLKDYIYIDGIERNNCVFYSYLPDTIAECQLDDPTFGTTGNTYGEYQPLFLSVYPAIIKNATFIAHNTRYPLHICNGNPQPQQGETIIVENCNLIHEGKFGDAVGTIGGSASGFGSADGVTCILRKCMFKTAGNASLYYHDGIGYENGVTFIFEDCIVNNSSKLITIENFSNNVGSKLIIKNIRSSKNGIIEFSDLGNSVADNYADTCKVDADFDFDAKPLNIDGGYALRIEALADNSTVRFNPSSSAFDVIVGNSGDAVLQLTNKYNRCQQYGYQWRDGGVNLKGEAIGFINVDANKNLSLGTRLGDCSSNNKTLNIIINGTTYTVTFNRDYTSVSNDDVIAEINAVIGSVATASVYQINQEWYPNFKGLEWVIVDDEGSIKRGMGVVYTETGVRKAKSTDGYIDGIAVDNGVNGSQIRIVTGGVINFNDYVCPLLTSPEHHYNVPYNTGYAIGTNDGEFVSSENNVVLRKDYGNSIRFV